MKRSRLLGLLLTLVLLLPIIAACGGDTGTAGTGATSGAGAGTGTEATAATGGTGTEATAATGTGGVTAATAETTPMAEATADGGAMTETATASTGAGMAETATTAAGAGGTSGGQTAAMPTVDWSKVEVEDGAQLRFGAAGNPTEQQIYIDGANRFQEAFPNVTLTFEPVNDYQTSMKAAMAGGTGPDVFLLDAELMGAFAPEGLLLPLDDTMQQAGLKTSDYYEPLIELYQQDGQTLGVPKDFNPVVLFVNDQMAQEAGVDPQNIKTWDDMKEAAQKMTKGEGPGKTYGVCLNSDILRSGAFIFQNGNEMIQDNKAVLNDPKAVQAIEFWKSFKDDGTGELYTEMGKGWCGEAFSGKNAGMVLEGGWLIPFMADPANGATDVKYTAVPLPKPEGGQDATWLFTNGFAANAKSQFPKAAAAAAVFLAGPENQQAVLQSGLAAPSLKALANDPFFQNDPNQQVLVAQGQNGRLADTLLGGPIKKGDVLKPINEAQERIFLGAQTVQEAMDQAAQEVDAVLAR